MSEARSPQPGRQEIERQRHGQHGVEAEQQRERLGEAAQHRAGDVRPEIDVGLDSIGNSVPKMTPAKKIGMNVIAHDATTFANPGRARNVLIGTTM